VKQDPRAALAVLSLAVIGVFLVGCVRTDTAGNRISPIKAKLLQRLGTLPIPAAAPVQPAKTTSMRSVTIAWSNMPPLWNGVTALEGSTNLVNWYTVWSAEAKVGDIVVTLSNRPTYEFYRAYNSL
jgi:hypothetical protein